MTPHSVLESNEFKSLVKKRWTFSLAMAAIMLLVYFGFLLTIAFRKEFFAQKIASGLTLGIALGLGIIIFAWIMTGIYVKWANSSYDEKVNELTEKVKSANKQN